MPRRACCLCDPPPVRGGSFEPCRSSVRASGKAPLEWRFSGSLAIDRMVARWHFGGVYWSRWAASDLYCPSQLLGVAAHDAGWLQKLGANGRREKPRKNGTKERSRSARGRACMTAAMWHMPPTTADPACAMAPPATPPGLVRNAKCSAPLEWRGATTVAWNKGLISNRHGDKCRYTAP